MSNRFYYYSLYLMLLLSFTGVQAATVSYTVSPSIPQANVTISANMFSVFDSVVFPTFNTSLGALTQISLTNSQSPLAPSGYGALLQVGINYNNFTSSPGYVAITQNYISDPSFNFSLVSQQTDVVSLPTSPSSGNLLLTIYSQPNVITYQYPLSNSFLSSTAASVFLSLFDSVIYSPFGISLSVNSVTVLAAPTWTLTYTYTPLATPESSTYLMMGSLLAAALLLTSKRIRSRYIS